MLNAGSDALTGDGPAEQIPGAEMTGGFFTVLGVAPELGGTLRVGDGVVGAERVAVLGHGVWQPRFDGLPPVDPLAFTGATTIIPAVAPLSSVGPARRAAGVELMVALRAE